MDNHPQDPDAFVALPSRNSNALRRPIVVDWHNGLAAAGDADGVKRLWEELKKQRDGEV